MDLQHTSYCASETCIESGTFILRIYHKASTEYNAKERNASWRKTCKHLAHAQAQRTGVANENGGQHEPVRNSLSKAKIIENELKDRKIRVATIS